MGLSKSWIANHRFGSLATERLINLAFGPNRTSQSVHQLVYYNLRTLDGRGRDLRISGAEWNRGRDQSGLHFEFGVEPGAKRLNCFGSSETFVGRFRLGQLAK